MTASSICRVNSSSFGRLIHDMVSALTNCSDSMGGSGCDGQLPLVQKHTASLYALQRKTTF